MDNKVIKCISMRYKDRMKGYKKQDPVTRNIFFIRDVIFVEIMCTSNTKETLGREKGKQKVQFDLKSEKSDSDESIESIEEVVH